MNYKEATREFLLTKYKEFGAKKTISLAMEMLKSKSHRDNLQFVADLHGEICESVLEIVLLEFMSRYPELTKDWRLEKGMILKDKKNISKEFFTEIDLVLMTPACMFLFECKSYAGDKVLTGSGKLTRTVCIDGVQSKKTCDVYRQSVLHKEVFYEWFKQFVVRGKEPLIQMCMFDFSLGELVDRRSRAAKIEMPCLGVGSVLQYVSQPGEIVWDVTYFDPIIKKLQNISDQLRSRHLSYVKGLHGGK